jgi:hypothetical protein
MSELLDNHNSEKKFYYSEKDSSYGPFNQFELKNLINENTSVSSDGIHWIKASNLPELKDYFEAKKTKKQLRLVIIIVLSCLLIALIVMLFNKFSQKGTENTVLTGHTGSNGSTRNSGSTGATGSTGNFTNDPIKPEPKTPRDSVNIKKGNPNNSPEENKQQDTIAKKHIHGSKCEALQTEYENLISKIPTEHNSEFFKLRTRKLAIEIELQGLRCTINTSSQ